MKNDHRGPALGGHSHRHRLSTCGHKPLPANELISFVTAGGTSSFDHGKTLGIKHALRWPETGQSFSPAWPAHPVAFRLIKMQNAFAAAFHPPIL
jgi:hypothetical protein